MIFKGELSRYHPADAMMFISQVGVDGVLSVADDESIIALTFKSGKLLDAQSAAGDRKLLRCLRHENRLNDSQVHQIQQIQRETGLSVRQLLVKLDFFPLADIRANLKMGMMEVMRQLFLLDRGTFNFTETPVEDDGARILLDTDKISLKILPQTDEFRDFIKSILSIDRTVQIHEGASDCEKATAAERLVLGLARRGPTVSDLLAQAPIYSHEVLQHLQHFLDKGVLSLGPSAKAPSASTGQTVDPLFTAFRQALKTLFNSQEVMVRLEAMISFAKFYYDDMLILSARQGEFIHCKTIRMDPGKGLVQKTIKGNWGRIDQDAVFSTVHRSGIAFLGKTFPCDVLDHFINQRLNGDCALIPILAGGNLSIFLYVCSDRNYAGLSPHHYLELLSWNFAPSHRSLAQPQKTGAGFGGNQQRAADSGPPEAAQSDAPPETIQKRIEKMVSRINDLPPLPTLVSKVLQMLSNPETPFEDIESIISRDQALVAKLIKVGNSALYGGLQKVGTLRNVLTRLGLKTTRNLILAASTRSYFLGNRKSLHLWGQFLWQHAVETGLAARRIAERLQYPDPEEAFVGGLIHDIGKLIMLMLYSKPYIEILKMKKVNQVASKSAEMQVLGCDHEQIGKLLMDRWNMPESAKACAQFHHRYKESEMHGDLVAIVAYADQLSRQYGGNPESLLAEDHAYTQELRQGLRITEIDHNALVAAVIEDFQNAELLLE